MSEKPVCEHCAELNKRIQDAVDMLDEAAADMDIGDYYVIRGLLRPDLPRRQEVPE